MVLDSHSSALICGQMSSTFQTDFDRIALASPEGELHNQHYHNFLLKHLPEHCDQVLEIGCGQGSFARALAARSNYVQAIDLSPQMIRLARERSVELGTSPGHQKSQGKEGGLPPLGFSNIDFQVGDILECDLPADHFDCIASIATLHHLPLREVLLKMKAALKPGGVLLVLDLFEPHGAADFLLNFAALPMSIALRLLHHRRLRPSRDARAAWKAHEAHDLYPTMPEVRALCNDILPNAQIKKHLLWRYSIVWQNTAQANS